MMLLGCKPIAKSQVQIHPFRKIKNHSHTHDQGGVCADCCAHLAEQLAVRVFAKHLPHMSANFRKLSTGAVETFFSEVAEKSVSARPGPILEGTLGSRMGPGRAGMAPTSGPGWVRNAGKQSTWRIWIGPLRTRDGTWTGRSGPRRGSGWHPQRQ